MSMLIREIQPYWTVVSPYLSIRDESDYDRAIAQLNELLDEVGTDETHPMYEFLDTLGTLIHAYEQEQITVPDVDSAGVFQYLMEEHQLRQTDFPEVGSQGVVSEIVNGKRQLNLRQIRNLAQRFHVSPAVFI